MSAKKIPPPSRYVVDASALVDGRVTEAVRGGQFADATLLVPQAVVAAFAHQAAERQATGLAGLNELKQLQALARDGAIHVVIAGEAPRGGWRRTERDDTAELTRRLAVAEGAPVITSDRVQALVCEGSGIAVHSFDQAVGANLERLALLAYFDEQTMSVHLRAHTRAKAKRGAPGHMAIVPVSDELLSEREVEQVAREIVEAAEQHPDGFIEADGGGSTVVQLANLRIAIARPPFADAIEVTAVRPVARTKLADYAYAGLVEERLADRYRGVLVSGAPGAGKSTLVQAIADHLEASGWVIKTMEKPRDLVVSDEITQYTALNGDMANTADVLLLVRPDYTIFDEMRRTEDFQVFADLRLSGVGMVGVVHATRGIDALQRLIGRVELGMIPQIVDTVVFIDAGEIHEVYEVALTVKMPTGMGDEGLARPVIEVRDYRSKMLAYEIYSFGEQVVVMPMGEVKVEKPLWRLAERSLEHQLTRELKGHVQVEIQSDDRVVLYVDEYRIGGIVGRGGSNIRALEEELGLKLEVRAYEARAAGGGYPVEVSVNRQQVVVEVDDALAGKTLELLVDGEQIFLGAASRNGLIKLRRGTEPAEAVSDAVQAGRRVRARRV